MGETKTGEILQVFFTIQLEKVNLNPAVLSKNSEMKTDYRHLSCLLFFKVSKHKPLFGWPCVLAQNNLQIKQFDEKLILSESLAESDLINASVAVSNMKQYL